MATPKTISIDGTEYVPLASIPATPKGSKRIVVLQRGWVVVGSHRVLDNGDHELTGASVIRVWGTTRGLGEIALGGPTSKTVLDPVGTVQYNPLTAVMVIMADESKWA